MVRIKHLALAIPLWCAAAIAQAAPPEDGGSDTADGDVGDPPQELSPEELETLTAEGTAAFEREDYANAAKSFRPVYEQDPNRSNLWNYAQAVRMAGNCEVALPLYEEFVEGVENPEGRKGVQTLIDDCKTIVNMGEGTDEPEGPGPNDVETPEGPDETEPLGPPIEEAEPIKPWYQDPLAPTLLGLGIAATAAGVTLLGIADDRERNLESSATYNEFVGNWHDQQRRARCYDSANEAVGSCRDYVIAGASLAGAGGALIIGGVVRYLVLSIAQKKASEGSQELVVEPTASQRGLGLSVSGRF